MGVGVVAPFIVGFAVSRQSRDGFGSLTDHLTQIVMKDYRRIAEDFARHLEAQYGERIVRILLFGSVARGDYSEDSDVDLIVIGHGDRLALQDEIAGDSVRSLLDTGVLVSAMVFTEEEMGEDLRYDVRSRGRPRGHGG